MGSKETQHQKHRPSNTGRVQHHATHPQALKHAHLSPQTRPNTTSHGANHNPQHRSRADLQKEQARKLHPKTVASHRSAADTKTDRSNHPQKLATSTQRLDPHPTPKTRSINPAQSRLATAPVAAGVVTEAQLVAKERMIASLRDNKRRAEHSKASRGFFDGGGRAADEDDIKRYSQLIALSEKSWQRMWKKRYLASTPEQLPAKQAVVRQIDKLQAVASKNVTRGLVEFDKVVAKAEYKRDLVQKLYQSVRKDQDERGFVERTFFFRGVNQQVDQVKGLLQKHENYVAKLHNKRKSLVDDYFGFVAYLNEGRTTISRQPEFKKTGGDTPRIEVKPVRSFNAAFAAVAQASDTFRQFTISAHAKQRVAPAERRATLMQNSAASIDKLYGELNLLEKAFAGDLRSNVRASAELANQSSQEALQQTSEHRHLNQEFNSFADRINRASAALGKGRPLSFIVKVGKANSGAANAENTYTVDFSESGISNRLGLSKRVLVIGAFTRKNEGSPDPESKHFEGKIHWPRFASGVTIAGGYDIGYKSRSIVKNDLVLADRALRAAGKDEIPRGIKSQLLAGVGKQGVTARDFLNQHPALKSYRFDHEATTVFFHQYFKRELATAERVVNKNMQEKVFRKLPVEVQALIADTVTRGDFKSLRNADKRQAFYSAVRNGSESGDWGELAEIYTQRKVFTLNPKIDRHKLRAGLARSIEDKYGEGSN